MVDLNNKDYIREVQDVSGYYITKDGKVWSSKRNKWLRPVKTPHGYSIWKCDRYTHEKIEKFHCICAAAQKLGKLQWSKHIGDVLKGRRKSAYGFWWCYAETEMAK